MGMWEDAQAQGPATNMQLLNQGVSHLAPYATTISTQDNMGQIGAQQLPKAPASSGNILENLANFAGTVIKGTIGMAGDAIHGLASAAVDTVEAPFKFGGDLFREGQISSQIDANNHQMQSLNLKVQQLANDYKSGRINQKQYKDGLNNLNGAFDQLNKATQEANSQANQNANDTLQQGLTTASDVIAVVTAGASEGFSLTAQAAAKMAADGSAANMIKFFGTREVGDQLFSAATKIDTVVKDVVAATNKVTTWNGLLPQGKIALLAHDAIQSGTETLTSQQIAKNVAVNLLLKRPIVYQTNIDLATDLYKNLAKGNLSGAALETALMGSMALMGGPIGAAMEMGGKAGETLKAMMFPKGAAADVMKITTEGKLQAEEYIANAATQSASRQSFNNNVSLFIGDKTQGQIDRVLADMMANGEESKVLMWKVLEQTNMKMAGGNAATASGYLKDFFNSIDDGRWLGTKSAEDLVNHGVAWARNREAAVQSAMKYGGMSRQQAQRIVIGRMDASDKQMIVDTMAKVDAQLVPVMQQGKANFDTMAQIQEARVQALNDLSDKYPNAAWANSETMLASIKEVLMNTPDSTEEMARRLLKIRAGKELDQTIAPEVRDQMAKDGHIAVLPKRNTYTPYVSPAEATKDGLKFKSNAVPKDIKESDQASLFEHAVAPVPVLQSFGKFLTNLGLSPEGTQDLVQQSFRNNFNSLVKNSEKLASGSLQKMGGEDIITKLYDEIRGYNNGETHIRVPITDLRQLTTRRIRGALGSTTTEAEAKEIMASINTAMLKVPLSVRGLGDRIQDINMRVNPLATWYSRVQGSGRFVWNPFFRTQQAYQTEMLSQMEAKSEGGFKMLQLPLLNRVNQVVFGHQWNDVQDTLKALEDKEIFAPHIQSSTMVGIEGRIGTRITKSEKQSLAGLVTKLSNNAGYDSVDRYVSDNEPAVIDLLRTITTNNHTTGTLDSPLVRSINLAFFPFRYNMKVAGLMADKLSQLSAPTQVALLAGMYNFNDWLRSDEGVAWQQQHSQALNLFNWLSPTYPLSYIIKLGEDVLHPGEASVGDLGMLGGLPFGFVGQFLENAGVINMSPPYINPTTGEVYPKYVPQNNRALTNLALQDMIGQVFTYPGAIVGLPSKGSILRGFTNALVGGGSTKGATPDFQAVPQQLTPDQQHQQQVIQQQAEAQGTAKQSSQAPTGQPTIPANQVASLPQPDITAPPRKTSASTKTAKKKKTDFRPAPL